MFEHLDDPQNAPSGTGPRLAAVHRRGRDLIAHRRRTRLATGSVALAATAGVTALATVGPPDGRAGAVGAGGGVTTTSPTPSATTSATPAASATTPASTPWTKPRVVATTEPAACVAVGKHLFGPTAPSGYARWSGSGAGHEQWIRPGVPQALLSVDVWCGPLAKIDITPGGDGHRTLTKLNLPGRQAWLWHEYNNTVAGIVWSVGDTANVLVETMGGDTAASARLSDDQLITFAQALPAS